MKKFRRGYSMSHNAIEVYGEDNKVVAYFPLPPNNMGVSTDREGRKQQERNADQLIAVLAAS